MPDAPFVKGQNMPEIYFMFARYQSMQLRYRTRKKRPNPSKNVTPTLILVDPVLPERYFKVQGFPSFVKRENPILSIYDNRDRIRQESAKKMEKSETKNSGFSVGDTSHPQQVYLTQ